MALTPRSGSSTSPSSPALPSDIPNTQSDLLPETPFVSDSSLNKYAIDTTQYPNTTKQLVGFMKGKRVSVTYYRLMDRESGNNRTNIADLPTQRNVLDTEYHKILNLEITLPKGFEFATNQAQANISIKGQAMFYPNMNPNVGDIFLMGTGDGRIGLCQVSSAVPTSWRQDRIFIVDFLVKEFVDGNVQDPINGSVTLTSVFSKENYLGGTAALLSEQTYLQLLKIKQMRSILSKFYHQSFFDTDISSYLRPDGVYDPYLVHFISNKISMDDIPIRPKNLLGQIGKLYERTLWSRLEDRYNVTMYLLSPCAVLEGYQENRMGAFITELYGRSIVTPSLDGDPYIYSANFYKGLTNDMTTEELMIFKAVTERTSGELSVLINEYLTPVFTIDPQDQFYKIPLFIHLIDMALQSQYREIDAPSMSYANNGDGD